MQRPSSLAAEYLLKLTGCSSNSGRPVGRPGDQISRPQNSIVRTDGRPINRIQERKTVDQLIK